MKLVKVFVDSDVVISSLISSQGAAYLLLNKANIERFISNVSQKEMEVVIERLHLEKSKLHALIKKQFAVVKIEEDTEHIKKEFSNYTSDENDAHIVAGAKKAKATFLVSYNMRHFKKDAIKEDLGIIVATPARLLQYLRSTL